MARTAVFELTVIPFSNSSTHAGGSPVGGAVTQKISDPSGATAPPIGCSEA